MADISQVTLPDGSVYNLKDSLARSSLSYLIPGTSVTEGVFQGQLPVSALSDGLMITYIVPSDATGEFKLNLTYHNSVTTTGAIPIYTSKNNKLSGSFSAGATISLVYYSKGSININGTPTTQSMWICISPVLEFVDFGGDDIYDEEEEEEPVTRQESIYTATDNGSDSVTWEATIQTDYIYDGNLIIFEIPNDCSGSPTLELTDITEPLSIYTDDETLLSGNFKAGTTLLLKYCQSGEHTLNGEVVYISRFMAYSIGSDIFAVNDSTDRKNRQAEYMLQQAKTGLKYGVHFDDFDTNPASAGTRLYDAVGKVIIPSTNIAHNQNDFEGVGPFAFLEVNGYVDPDGDFHVTAIKDVDDTFSRTTADTWCLFATHYIKTTIDANGEDIVISDKMFDGASPCANSIRPDGTIRPFVPIAKYMASDVDGVQMSVSGKVATQHSYNSTVTAMHNKGTQYCAQTMQDIEFLRTLFQVAFATRNSASVLAGCNSYNLQYYASVEETNVERIIIPKSQANNLLIGSCVSIGKPTALNFAQTAANIDRGQNGMHSKANRVIITNIEEYDSSNSIVHVDNGGAKFDTTSSTITDSNIIARTYISTMQWHTGICDEVNGVCGSPTSSSSNKEPYILFGVELQLGYWEPCGNTILRAENHLLQPYICYDSINLTSNATNYSTDYTKIGYTIGSTNASWKYVSKVGYDANNPGCRIGTEFNATSSIGYADALYTEKLESLSDGNMREVLLFGYLYNGAYDGLWFSYLRSGLGYSYWYFASRLSGTGRSGALA